MSLECQLMKWVQWAAHVNHKGTTIQDTRAFIGPKQRLYKTSSCCGIYFDGNGGKLDLGNSIQL